MSTTNEKISENASGSPEHMLDLRNLTELLIKHHDIHQGLYELRVEFQIGVGAVGPAPDKILPGALFGVSRVGISPVQENGPSTVDAADVNPIPKPRAKAARRAPKTPK